MSISILCNSCGRQIEVGDDYARRKVQCPDCGVLCELPAQGAKGSPVVKTSRPVTVPPAVAKAKPSAPRETQNWPDPPLEKPLPKPKKPSRESRSPEEPKPTVSGQRCPHCRQMVRAPASGGAFPEFCPHCSRALAEPVRTAPPPPIDPYTVPREDSWALQKGDDDDDGTPYILTGGLEQHCPECTEMLPASAKVCTRCGVDLKTGEKPVKVYEKISRTWHGGLTLRQRFMIFLCTQLVVLPLVVLQFILEKDEEFSLVGSLLVSCFIWSVFTVMLAFVLGTFERIDFSRNKRGQVLLTKTWRACFIPRPTETIKIGPYEGIATGVTNEVYLSDYLFLGIMFASGVLPGILWWYVSFHKVTHFVALTKHHGAPEMYLYRGWSKELMEDMSQTLHEAAELPFQGK